MRLPVITGFGGVNAAGRSFGHHGYCRLVSEVLPDSTMETAWRSLAALTGQSGEVSADTVECLRHESLIRRIGPALFDTEAIPLNGRLPMTPDDGPIRFVTQARYVPEELPSGWEVATLDERRVRVTINEPGELLLPGHRRATVRSAGQLPTGFEPGSLYQSRSHPRGIQMTVFGASDALGSLGVDWESVKRTVPPDRISVYAGSGMGQLDGNANGGMMMSRLSGRRVTSKHCPFGFAEMPADFINAYVLGSLGNTGTSMGACASFLYNLRQAVSDIQQGVARVALVGNSEAPITPEVMEGYAAMGALATDAELLKLDGRNPDAMPDYARACRPFSTNCGFTIAESAQFLVLMDDALALELGAPIHGSVSHVFVNADGHKKSISAPGVGNYLTLMKTAAAARALVGEEGLRQRSFVQAHGTGTPQNRVTESRILDQTARVFGIEQWPVAAVKAYLGHSIGAAAGDQVVASLGVWAHGWIPGVATIDHVADDVSAERLRIAPEHLEVGPEGTDVALINAKGFGGNNASACVLAPHVTRRMLEKRHGRRAMTDHAKRHETVQAAVADFEARALAGRDEPRYLFDHNVLDGEDLSCNTDAVHIPGYAQPVDLHVPSGYDDMLE